MGRARSCAIAIVVALGAVGCFSDRGLAIEVDVGKTGATQVELYLGKLACDPERNPAGIDCKQIAPPDGTIALAGDIWFRDSLAIDIAKATRGQATFRIEAGSDTTLPIVIAVGLADDQGAPHAVGAATLRDLEIPANRARVATTTLAATSAVKPAQRDTGDLDEDRALVWSKSAPPSSCVVVEHWRPGQTVARDFIVPVEDPDCDDVVRECNPAAYHGTSAAGDPSAVPDCFAKGDIACRLGNRGCSDDSTTRSGTCVAQPPEVCVPGVFCGCTGLDAACLRGLIDDGEVNMIPRIVCEVPAVAGPELALCDGNNSATIDLSAQFQGTHCGHDPEISTLALGEPGTSADFGGAIMELGTAAEPCSFEVKWKSGARPVVTDTDDRGVVRLEADHAALLVPIVFHFDGVIDACTTKFTCGLQGSPDDTLWSCTR